ncbi:MAG TPA: ABC transporter permease [Pyrinomonadaceae bacterium]|nr:ABC transporter permease [Pyrinomonadaceae bacterium]
MTVATREGSSSLPEPDTAAAAAAKPLFNRSTKSASLPDEPLATIEPNKSWGAFDRRELWAHRELLYFLALRDLRTRYKQTLVGAVWVILQPLMMTLIFTVFLGLLVRVPSAGLPYPVFIYSGLLPWMFISGGIIGCSSSITGNANLLTKVYFPRVLLPTAYLATKLVDFCISFVILAILILIYRVVLHYQVVVTWKLAVLPFIVILMTVFTLSIGILAASLNVRYRDVGVALPVLIQLWMFTSPIIYPPDLIPLRWHNIYSLNPIVGLIQGFRGALLGTEIPRLALAVSAIVTAILVVCAAFVFRQTEKGFADVV